MKPALRAGLDVAGVAHRLIDGEFVYVDKNAVRLLGGVRPAVERALALGHGPVAVQVEGPVAAMEAVAAGCRIVMVDTGVLSDLASTAAALATRDDVLLAFGGGVGPESLEPHATREPTSSTSAERSSTLPCEICAWRSSTAPWTSTRQKGNLFSER